MDVFMWLLALCLYKTIIGQKREDFWETEENEKDTIKIIYTLEFRISLRECVCVCVHYIYVVYGHICKF